MNAHGSFASSAANDGPRNLYQEDVDAMRRAAGSPVIAHKLITLLEQPRFTDFLPGTDDYARSVQLLDQLRTLRCDNDAKVGFVRAFARRHSVVDACEKSFPNPGRHSSLFDSPYWEQTFIVVQHVIEGLALERDETTQPAARVDELALAH